jgi:DNA-binding SARP family transcriptional activator
MTRPKAAGADAGSGGESEQRPAPALRLCLLGAPRLIVGDTEIKLERKDGLMLAWLALEGPTPRARLAALLFPDAGEAGARGALRQRIYRARLTPAAGLVTGDDPLRLADNVLVDLADPAAPGELLTGLAAADLPELEEWLGAQRVRRQRGRIDWLAAAAEKAAAEGDLATAIERARAAIEADPLFEPSHRRLMRLHYLHGDPASARAAYQTLHELLRRELGAAPARERRRSCGARSATASICLRSCGACR